MWDFSVALSVKLVLRTLPFLLLRAAISLLSVAVLGIAFIGGMYALGWISRLSLVPEIRKWSVIAGLAGLGIGFLILRWARAWVLYLVKAAHIAVLVEMIHGRPLPPGSGQIGYGQSVVRERFGEASALFVLDGLVRAALRMINRLTMGFLSVLPDKLARQIAFAVNTVLYFAIGLIDEIILAHAINNRSTDAWGSAADALALYRQNWKAILKNALWLTLFAVALGWLLYTFLFEPAQAAYTLDPETGRRGYFLSIAISSLILATYFGPFALISMLQVWFRLIAAQPVAPRARAEVGRIAPSLTAMGGPRVPLRTVGTNGPRNGDLI